MQVPDEIDVFWFKRDLRLTDNEALRHALNSPRKVLLIYLYEQNIWQDNHYDKRHVNFVKESLNSISQVLAEHKVEILLIETEVIIFFNILRKQFCINTVYSTQESGLDVTFKRDIEFGKYCFEAGIEWKEFQNNGVIRGLRNRLQWRNHWYKYMKAPIVNIDWKPDCCLSISAVKGLSNSLKVFSTKVGSHNFQKGGRPVALEWKKSFFSERIIFYSDYISKPELARYGCSRLSPYFAWGNLSIREVYQEALELKKTSPHKRQLNAFLSRLRWQSHFIQKFEMEPRMEFEAVNRGFVNLVQPFDENFVNRWKNGQTGYPLVDASLRCVVQTGYINFRMRSMVTSFLTHHLFQHFTTGGPWLARQFLDFEPGIHYGQMQMQAGFTGTNTVRVYNPTKNALDHDSDAVFIKKYVPELNALPAHLAIEPWNITKMEEQLYGFEYGVTYPIRIVDIAVTRKFALQKLYGQRKSDLAKSEKLRILEKHTLPNRKYQ